MSRVFLCVCALGVSAGAAEDLGGAATATVPDVPAAIAAYDDPEWVLRWGDEFTEAGRPDPSRWTYEKGLVRNGEAQFYTDRPENIRVLEGSLIITARREPWEGAPCTSASLTSQGRFSFTGGKAEIRAKVPPGRGTWPALWTLGDNITTAGWPACGEIDLMEYVGMHPELVHFTVHTMAFNHTKQTQRGTRITEPRVWADYHRYGLVWTQSALTWYFDGRPVFAFANDGQGRDHWPFDQPHYLLMNLAIGGVWGGQKGIDEALFPAELRVDYVRVWQKP